MSWIKVHRKILDSHIFDDAEVFKIWLYCLLRAEYGATKHIVNGQLVYLQSGQFIFGRKKWSKDLNIGETKLRKSLQILETTSIKTVTKNNKFSIYEILNFSSYQGQNSTTTEPACDAVIGESETSKKPSKNHQRTIKEPAENHQKEKKLNFFCSENEQNRTTTEPACDAVARESDTSKEPAKNHQRTIKEPPSEPHLKEERNKEEDKKKINKRKSPDEFSALTSDVLFAWSEICADLPQPRKWTPARNQKLMARIGEDKARQHIAFWQELFKAVAQSPFLSGQNDRGWTVDLPWVLKSDDTIIAILEGKYAPRQSGVNSGQAVKKYQDEFLRLVKGGLA